MRNRIILSGLLGAMIVSGARAQEPNEREPIEIVAHVLVPSSVGFAEGRLDSLQLPQGFRIEVFARDLGHARMLAAAEDGWVYLTRPEQGDVLMLRDADGDGSADENRTAARDLEKVHGIALDGDTVYLAAPAKLWRASRQEDGSFGEPELIMDDLPDGGQHPNRTLAARDGKLYISVGSSCDACDEPNPEHATILEAELDGSSRETFARGLRNTIGFGWHPETGEMWGMDHGTDYRGDDEPPEELNRLERGNHYGWPIAYGDREPDPVMSQFGEMDESVAETTPPVLTYEPHAAPIGMVFYEGEMFPEEYRGDAFIAFRGSWNRQPPSGYEIVRLRFENGEPAGFEDFVSGFLLEDGRSQWARLAGIAVAADGALLFTDDENGVIYRVTHGATPPSE